MRGIPDFPFNQTDMATPPMRHFTGSLTAATISIAGLYRRTGVAANAGAYVRAYPVTGFPVYVWSIYDDASNTRRWLVTLEAPQVGQYDFKSVLLMSPLMTAHQGQNPEEVAYYNRSLGTAGVGAALPSSPFVTPNACGWWEISYAFAKRQFGNATFPVALGPRQQPSVAIEAVGPVRLACSRRRECGCVTVASMSHPFATFRIHVDPLLSVFPFYTALPPHVASAATSGNETEIFPAPPEATMLFFHEVYQEWVLGESVDFFTYTRARKLYFSRVLSNHPGSSIYRHQMPVTNRELILASNPAIFGVPLQLTNGVSFGLSPQASSRLVAAASGIAVTGRCDATCGHTKTESLTRGIVLPSLWTFAAISDVAVAAGVALAPTVRDMVRISMISSRRFSIAMRPNAYYNGGDAAADGDPQHWSTLSFPAPAPHATTANISEDFASIFFGDGTVLRATRWGAGKVFVNVSVNGSSAAALAFLRPSATTNYQGQSYYDGLGRPWGLLHAAVFVATIVPVALSAANPTLVNVFGSSSETSNFNNAVIATDNKLRVFLLPASSTLLPAGPLVVDGLSRAQWILTLVLPKDIEHPSNPTNCSCLTLRVASTIVGPLPQSPCNAEQIFSIVAPATSFLPAAGDSTPPGGEPFVEIELDGAICPPSALKRRPALVAATLRPWQGDQDAKGTSEEGRTFPPGSFVGSLRCLPDPRQPRLLCSCAEAVDGAWCGAGQTCWAGMCMGCPDARSGGLDWTFVGGSCYTALQDHWNPTLAQSACEALGATLPVETTYFVGTYLPTVPTVALDQFWLGGLVVPGGSPWLLGWLDGTPSTDPLASYPFVAWATAAEPVLQGGTACLYLTMASSGGPTEFLRHTADCSTATTATVICERKVCERVVPDATPGAIPFTTTSQPGAVSPFAFTYAVTPTDYTSQKGPSVLFGKLYDVFSFCFSVRSVNVTSVVQVAPSDGRLSTGPIWSLSAPMPTQSYCGLEPLAPSTTQVGLLTMADAPAVNTTWIRLEGCRSQSFAEVLCSVGWIAGPRNRCLKKMPVAKSWADAKTACSSLGAEIGATATLAEGSVFWRRQSFQSVWLGAWFQGNKWVTSSFLDFSKLVPVSYGGSSGTFSGYCLMYSGGSAALPVPCTAPFMFFCERSQTVSAALSISASLTVLPFNTVSFPKTPTLMPTSSKSVGISLSLTHQISKSASLSPTSSLSNSTSGTKSTTLSRDVFPGNLTLISASETDFSSLWDGFDVNLQLEGDAFVDDIETGKSLIISSDLWRDQWGKGVARMAELYPTTFVKFTKSAQGDWFNITLGPYEWFSITNVEMLAIDFLPHAFRNGVRPNGLPAIIRIDPDLACNPDCVARRTGRYMTLAAVTFGFAAGVDFTFVLDYTSTLVMMEADCDIEARPLPFALHPLQIEIGKSPYRYAFGVGVCNTAILGCLVIVHLLLVGRLMKQFSHTFASAASSLSFPSLLFFPAAILTPGAFIGATTIVAVGSASEIVIGCFLLLVLLLILANFRPVTSSRDFQARWAAAPPIDTSDMWAPITYAFAPLGAWTSTDKELTFVKRFRYCFTDYRWKSQWFGIFHLLTLCSCAVVSSVKAFTFTSCVIVTGSYVTLEFFLFLMVLKKRPYRRRIHNLVTPLVLLMHFVAMALLMVFQFGIAVQKTQLVIQLLGLFVISLVLVLWIILRISQRAKAVPEFPPTEFPPEQRIALGVSSESLNTLAMALFVKQEERPANVLDRVGRFTHEDRVRVRTELKVTKSKMMVDVSNALELEHRALRGDRSFKKRNRAFMRHGSVLSDGLSSSPERGNSERPLSPRFADERTLLQMSFSSAETLSGHEEGQRSASAESFAERETSSSPSSSQAESEAVGGESTLQMLQRLTDPGRTSVIISGLPYRMRVGGKLEPVKSRYADRPLTTRTQQEADLAAAGRHIPDPEEVADQRKTSFTHPKMVHRGPEQTKAALELTRPYRAMTDDERGKLRGFWKEVSRKNGELDEEDRLELFVKRAKAAATGGRRTHLLQLQQQQQQLMLPAPSLTVPRVSDPFTVFVSRPDVRPLPSHSGPPPLGAYFLADHTHHSDEFDPDL